MNIYELAKEMDKLLPVSLSEEWDSDGVNVAPDGSREIKKAVIALDATSAAIDYAVSAGADAIITHHPLIFGGIPALRDDDPVGRRALACARNGLAALSYHTRLDSVGGGVNDCLASAIGLGETIAFLPFGRIGELGNEQSFGDFVGYCEKALGERACALVRGNGKVKKVAVISGGGKDFIRDVYLAGADTFVTGEANHAAFIEAAEYRLNMICLTHHATERVVLPALAALVEKASGGSIATEIFDFDRVREYGV